MKKILILAIIATSTMFATSISEIQGTTHRSKYENQNVSEVRGVVTAVYKSKYNNGFFFQSIEPDNDLRTSEALWVTGDTSVNVGDYLELSGIVREIQFSKANPDELTITSLQMTDKKKLGENYKVEPYVIKAQDIPKNVSDFKGGNLNIKENAMDYYESLENMLVRINDPVISGSKEGHGEISVLPDGGKYVENFTNNGGVRYTYENEQTHRVIIGDELISLRKNGQYIDPNFTPNPGDRFKAPIDGVLAFTYSNYKLFNTEKLPEIENIGAKVDTLKYEFNENMLNVVSYNIENFNRNQNRTKDLAKQIVNIFKSPDIIGLVEVEDDDGDKDSSITTADKNLKSIVKAISEAGGPKYDYINVVPVNKEDGGKPGANIRNAILYRSDRVKLATDNKGSSYVDTKVDENSDKFKLTVNPGRIGNNTDTFKETRKTVVAHFEFKGKDVVVMVNHLSSKRSDLPIYGVNKAVRKSEVRRVKQGEMINNFVKSVLDKDKNVNFVIMGDMNDFEFSPTLKAMEGNELFTVINELPEQERHTYVHQGNSQVLDHILINNKYKGKVNVDVLNINSEFTRSQGSFSDHDPVFIQFEVK